MKQDVDTKCWTCKHACGSRENQCCWAKDFTPVEGWEVLPGIKDYALDEKPGWVVLECPLYEDTGKWNSINECITELAKRYHVCKKTIQNHYDKYFKKYEKDTGKSVPAWIKKAGTKKEQLGE